MRDPEDVEQIDLVQVLPHLGFTLVEGPDAQVVADVVHEHIDPTVGAQHMVAEPVDVGVDAHVRGECLGVATGRDDLVHRLRRGGFVDVGDQRGCSVLGEERSGCPADPVRRTGDDGDLSVQERVHAAHPNVFSL